MSYNTFISKALIAVALTVVVSCSDTEPLPPTGDQRVTVRGTITAETVGDAVGGVTITLGERTTQSDVGGQYSFDTVEAGAYTVTPSMPGRTFAPISRSVIVQAEEVRGVDFQLQARTANDSIHMVLIPAGTYMRGADSAYLKLLEASVPKHRVTLTRSFWIGIHEVTQEQWLRVMPENNSRFKGDKKPITDITWVQALEFCNAMSDLHGLQRVYSNIGREPDIDWNANGYRLPTEAEWEYAAEAGDTSLFYGVPDLPPQPTTEERLALAASMVDYGWINVNSVVDGQKQTHDVGLLKPNAIGLYDMVGNVREFTIDCMAPYSGVDEVDPVVRNTLSLRCIRGGSFVSGGDGSLSTRGRHFGSCDATISNHGFRIARNQ